MRRAVLLCLVLLACRTAPTGPAVHRIHGAWTMHLGEKVPPTTRVLLGDGSRFTATPDAKGDVHFEDPSLEGPQDVTVLLGDESGAFAFTAASVNVDEMRLDAEVILHELTPHEEERKTTPVSGQVTSFIGPQVFATAFGPGLVTGGFITTKEGAFSSSLFGSSIPPAATFVAVESEKPFAQQVIRLGALPDVPLPLAGPVTIPLTHTLTDAVTVELSGLEAYAGKASAVTSLEPVPQQFLGLRREELGERTPLMFPPREGPFAHWPRHVQVSAGDALKDGAAEVTRTLDEASARIRLPRPPKLVDPPLPAGAAPKLPENELDFHWEPDREATVQALVVGSSSASGPGFAWLVVLPPSRHEFSFFRLPNDRSLSGPLELELLGGRSSRSWDELVRDGLFVNFDRALEEHSSIRRFFVAEPPAKKP